MDETALCRAIEHRTEPAMKSIYACQDCGAHFRATRRVCSLCGTRIGDTTQGTCKDCGSVLTESADQRCLACGSTNVERVSVDAD